MATLADPELVNSTHIPGTVHLVDLDGTLRTRHADTGDRDIVLIPTPSVSFAVWT